MPDVTDTIKPHLAATTLTRLNTRSETGSVNIPASELTKPGAFTVNNGVLTVQNAQLAKLINSKLADASALVPGGKAAVDVDAGVTVKVKG